MSASAFERGPRRESVSFDDGPLLVAQRQSSKVLCSSGAQIRDATGTAPGVDVVGPHDHEDEDDSVAIVFSGDTGAGRAHTPQRLNRTNTPQRPRSSSLLHTAAAPIPTTPASAEGEARRQRLGRRKQRRRENDKLLGVEKYLHGRFAQEEGEAKHLTVSHPWRSSLSTLVSDQNNSANAAELRESFRKGLQPSMSLKTDSSKPGSRRFAGGEWEDAEERFLLVERRLRDIVVRALRNSALLSFVEGLELLLEGFAQRQQALGAADLPAALSSALAATPTVNMGSGQSSRATLLVPLGPSPFHRLLLHALCQYMKLRSQSEETRTGRTVHVALPASGSLSAIPSALLTEFVVRTRLMDDGSKEALASAFPQEPSRTARCGHEAFPRSPANVSVSARAVRVVT